MTYSRSVSDGTRKEINAITLLICIVPRPTAHTNMEGNSREMLLPSRLVKIMLVLILPVIQMKHLPYTKINMHPVNLRGGQERN